MSVARALHGLLPDCGGDCRPTPYGPSHDLAHHEAVWEAARQPVGPAVWGRLSVDREDGTVAVDDVPLRCTPTEWRLLLALTEAGGRLVSRERLAAEIWPGWTPVSSVWHVLRVNTTRLRAKLRPHGIDVDTRMSVGCWLAAYDPEGIPPNRIGGLIGEDRRARVVALLRTTDWTLAAIAREAGVSPNTVWMIRDADGIVRDVARHRSRTLPVETRDAIERLLTAGEVGTGEIARQTRVSPTTVRRLARGLRAAGVALRRSARRRNTTHCEGCQALRSPLRPCRRCNRD